jgi:hypothetical protein
MNRLIAVTPMDVEQGKIDLFLSNDVFFKVSMRLDK